MVSQIGMLSVVEAPDILYNQVSFLKKGQYSTDSISYDYDDNSNSKDVEESENRYFRQATTQSQWREQVHCWNVKPGPNNYGG